MIPWCPFTSFSFCLRLGFVYYNVVHVDSKDLNTSYYIASRMGGCVMNGS